ncbi:MAG: hypothetical protein QGH20_00010 [Candidatus Latescibacteria bacterium]|nr:hypothetical protein [Candidatus Latescibacterota bacterium]
MIEIYDNAFSDRPHAADLTKTKGVLGHQPQCDFYTFLFELRERVNAGLAVR